MSKPLESYCVSEHATVLDAIAVIQQNESRCAVVQGQEGKVVGVLSEGDVLRALLAGVHLHAPLRNLVRPSFTFFRSHDVAAARPYFLKGMTLIPVVSSEFRLTSVIAVEDVFGAEV
jgi:CBS domain-containing protein